MTYKYTEGGLDFVEDVLVDDSFTEVVDIVAIGNEDQAPNETNTTLNNQLYEATDDATTVSIERGSGTGEIRATIEFTGGSEVPAGTDIVELGLKASDGTLLYHEVRDTTITVESGETKIVEVRIFVRDLDVEDRQTITDVGRDEIADMMVGFSSQKLDTIAIGSSELDVDASDTTMYDELYRGSSTESNIVVSGTANTGEIRAEATISAGGAVDDEVPAASTISEFGLFSNGTLILHETRPPITLESNDTKTFKIPFTIRQ